ncbi:4-formylbenzenesulfonate dehydrogenase TsaC1/TsaC2 [compost metagenome]
MDDDGLLEKAWDRIPLRRAGQPEEIASAVAFLASDEAAWITGIVLPVDGVRPAPTAVRNGVSKSARSPDDGPGFFL